MKKVIFIILAVLLVVGIGFKINEKMQQAASLQQQATQKKNRASSNIPAVKVQSLKPQPIKETLKVVGEIQVDTETAVEPRISGRLLTLLVDEGQQVRANQLIAVMDDENIRIQMQQSEASIVNIQASLRQSELNLSKAKTDLDRYKELLNQKYISQRDYDNAENSYLTSVAARDGIKAQLASAHKSYELLKLQLNQTKVYSPVSGIVLHKVSTIGTNLTTASTIITVAPLNPLKLVFNVDQKDTSRIHKGMRVEFNTDAFPNKPFMGAINEESPTYDSKTRTLSLSVNLRNPNNQLVPGMFGSVDITIGSKPNALVVPQEAVITQNDQTLGVFVVDKSNIAHFQPVTTGLVAEGQVELISGVNPGDSVVVIGQNRLRDGQKVQATRAGKNSGGKKGGKNGSDNPADRSNGKSGMNKERNGNTRKAGGQG